MPFLLDDTTAPRSVLSLEEMQDRVRGDLGLRDSSVITDADITSWLNEAQEIIARETSWYRTSETMGTTSGTKEYALPIPTAGRCIRIEEVKYDTEQLIPVTLDQLLQLDWNYRDAGNGTPEYYYVRGSSGFGLHYTPDTTDADILLVVFIAKPPRISEPDETFYVPHTLEQGLLIYAKKMACEKDCHGEGRLRLPFLRDDWTAFMQQAKLQANSAAQRVQTVMGESAVLGGRGLRRHPWRGSTIGQ